jgi:hypothetical protein
VTSDDEAIPCIRGNSAPVQEDRHFYVERFTGTNGATSELSLLNSEALASQLPIKILST